MFVFSWIFFLYNIAHQRRELRIKIFCLVGFATLIMSVSGCGAQPTSLQPTARPVAVDYFAPDYWPTRAWCTSAPEQLGMDSELLRSSMEFMSSQEVGIHSYMVIRVTNMSCWMLIMRSIQAAIFTMLTLSHKALLRC